MFNDFGDVRYEGSRYLAFCEWWRERVNTSETRGVYLFAEPMTGHKVEVIENEDMARAALADPENLVVVIPLTLQRRHIEKRLNQIFKSHLEHKAARLVRSVKSSRARYSLHTPVVPSALKKCFDLFDARQEAHSHGERIGNFSLAKRAGVKVQERQKDDEISTEANYRRTVSATVSRYIKKAETMIESAALGKFPY